MEMRRTLLGAMGAVFLAPKRLLAQPARQATVIVLYAGESEDDEPATRPFFDEMRRLGWSEGTNIAYERLSGKGMREYVEGVARTAAGRAPDLIFATTANIALAVLKATDTVPVLFTAASDPVAEGLVASLAKPGGNATGAYQLASAVAPKRFALVREALPGLKRIGALFDRGATSYLKQLELHRDAARRAGLELAAVEFTNFEAVLKILARFRREGITAAAIAPSFMLFARRREVGTAAARSGIALVAHRVEWAEAGALLSYGADIAETLRRSAGIAHKILKGARPAEIPVERATRLELVLNRRVANALGIALPKSLVARADRVID